MNRHEADILLALIQMGISNQRLLAETTGYSIGLVNKEIKGLQKEGYLSGELLPSRKAFDEIRQQSPKRAIILAAGYGMRMIPLNTERPKALLEVHGEVMIERQIRQLREAGVREIYVIVGFMKEQFEYLIDEYGVELIVNSEYASKNNLHSLKQVLDKLANAYVIPCDIWCSENPFHQKELYSWYMVSDQMDDSSTIRINRKLELVTVPQYSDGNAMIGIAYLTEQHAQIVADRVKELCQNKKYDDAFWEEALIQGDRMILSAKVVSGASVKEINTYEQLRELDDQSGSLQDKAILVIANVLQVEPCEITDIVALKKGMTNRSFLFSCQGNRYIMRIPGEGTDKLINRRREASVYRTIKEESLCDDVVYMDPQNGYKITVFLENARTCDPNCIDDLKKCMEKLRRFHQRKFRVEHEFDIFGQIAFYESLWGGAPSVYRDYGKTKQNVWELKAYIDTHAAEKVLTHIDAVPDNFLFAGEEVRLIDWEYAGMQDPHVDIAMFCIYSLYNRQQVDQLIDLYFENNCPQETRIKIYCYIAVCGLLWSNWCEYKRSCGVEFGEYALRQYRYAKDYYRIVKSIMDDV